MTEKLGDNTLALTLRSAISANCKIDGMSERLVEQLEFNQNRYREETKRIKQIEKDLSRTHN